MRIVDQARLVDDARDGDAAGGRERLLAPGVLNGLEPRPPGVDEVLDVLPLVVDLLAQLAERREAIDREARSRPDGRGRGRR